MIVVSAVILKLYLPSCTAVNVSDCSDTIFSTFAFLFASAATVNVIVLSFSYLLSLAAFSTVILSCGSSVKVYFFAFTVRFFVSSCKLPLLIVTGFWLSFNVKSAPFAGFVVIPLASNSASATSLVKFLSSVSVTTSPVKSNLSPSV